MTRLSATELLPGCMNCTDSPARMPKLCQLMATLDVLWVIVMLPGVPPMLALPADTTPPVGWASAPALQAIIRETARIFRPKRVWPPAAVQDEIFLPALRVFSETATKVPVWSFQIERWMMFMMGLSGGLQKMRFRTLPGPVSGQRRLTTGGLKVLDGLDPEAA